MHHICDINPRTTSTDVSRISSWHFAWQMIWWFPLLVLYHPLSCCLLGDLNCQLSVDTIAVRPCYGQKKPSRMMRVIATVISPCYVTWLSLFHDSMMQNYANRDYQAQGGKSEDCWYWFRFIILTLSMRHKALDIRLSDIYPHHIHWGPYWFHLKVGQNRRILVTKWQCWWFQKISADEFFGVLEVCCEGCWGAGVMMTPPIGYIYICQARAAGALEKAMTPDGGRPTQARGKGKVKGMMIWSDLIWSDLIWYDMIWYDITWYYMIYKWIWHFKICIHIHTNFHIVTQGNF